MRIILFLILTVLIYGPVSFAYDVSPNVVLSQVSVAVPDRSASALDQGLQTAFAQQMVKLSGDPKVMSTPRMQDAGRAVKLWVETYSYVEVPASSPQLPSSLMLQVTFNPTAMQKLLAENNVAVSGQVIEKNASPSEEKAITISVKNIQDEKDFRDLVRALQGIDRVDRVSTKGLQGDSVTVVVSYKGDVARFENRIAEDHRFKTSATPLEYEWAGREP